MNGNRRIALKVDCDTYEGTKNGIPNLLRLFEKRGISASFFFTLGPDNSGRAIQRVFTQKGFLKKMIRSNAVSMYGPKTMLYGTLLPAPQIGQRLKTEIKSVAEAGQEIGIHGWDHVRWHDRLGRMEEREIKEDCFKAHETFESIFGTSAHSMAAPGWHATATFLSIQDDFNLLYASNTRLGPPHFPVVGDAQFKTLEIPTTLPTWDESLSSIELRDPNALVDYYRKSIHGTEVHTIHTEVEGTAHLALFDQQLNAWKSDGVEFVSLETIAAEQLKNKSNIPFRNLIRRELPGRAGLVSSSTSLASIIAVA